MMLARMPAKNGAVFGIRDAGDFPGEAAPLGRTPGSGGREIGLPLFRRRPRIIRTTPKRELGCLDLASNWQVQAERIL
jgi:hypothetical protein